MNPKSHGKVTKTASQSDKEKIFWQKHGEHMEKFINDAMTSPEEVARISYRVGATINTGNYESLRVDVEVETPCLIKDVPATIEKVRKYAEEEISKDVVHYREIGGVR